MKEYSETIPIQYQEGTARFLGMDISVDPRVLIPRPETELLVETAAAFCRERAFRNPLILDLCTGSGIISIGLAKILRDCRIIGVDVSEEALEVARENVSRLDQEDKVELVVSDMFAAFDGKYEGSFDCIVSNPPYVSDEDYEKLDAWVKAEPRIALYAGKEGMEYLDMIACESGRFLRPGGFMAVEIGYDQSEKVRNRLDENGFVDIEGFEDINGYERVIVGWKNG
ncbi:peptide chain release factor N(5)-glutamine methyltransferase [Candidatus Omnitrophota bacterium]